MNSKFVQALKADCLTDFNMNVEEQKMPTLKTKKSATKRLKTSATGKVMRTQAGKSHLNGYKTRSRKRNLRGSTAVDVTFQKTAARMLQGN